MKRKLFVGIVIMFSLLLTGCGEKNTVTKESATEAEESSKQEVITPMITKDLPEMYLGIMNLAEIENITNDIQYDLVYFNDDNVPDLLVDKRNTWFSIYTYQDGSVHQLIDRWEYDSIGNRGYQYFEKKSVLQNYKFDYEGAIRILTYIKVKDSGNYDDLMSVELSKSLKKSNSFYEEIMDTYQQYGGYYYNDNKIEEDEYQKKKLEFIPGSMENTKNLNGSKKYEEVASILTNRTIEDIKVDRDVSKIVAKEVYEGALAKGNASSKTDQELYVYTDFVPVLIENKKMAFYAVSYYIGEENQNSIEQLKKELADLWAYKETEPERFVLNAPVYGIYIDVDTSLFSIVPEGENWLVEEFSMPY